MTRAGFFKTILAAFGILKAKPALPNNFAMDLWDKAYKAGPVTKIVPVSRYLYRIPFQKYRGGAYGKVEVGGHEIITDPRQAKNTVDFINVDMFKRAQENLLQRRDA